MTIPSAPDVPPKGPDMNADPVPPALAKSRKHWYFGAGGLIVGLAAGLVLGAVGGAMTGAMAESSMIPRAVDACSATGKEGVSIMDGGNSLNLQTAGEESTGTSVATVVCVLGGLDAPDSLYSKLESTRALDGTKSADWPGFTASWTYHPDNGLNIIVESDAK